jgi:hypothetical protein
MHNPRDPLVPFSQAKAYTEALVAGGTQAQLAEVEGSEIPRPIGGIAETGLEFIGKTFHVP